MSTKAILILLNGTTLGLLGQYYQNASDGFVQHQYDSETNDFCYAATTYRAILHPLARYPAPWGAALTDWYTVYHIVKGDRHINFYRLHEKYGNVVRFGPGRISVRSASALKDIYGVSANVKRSQEHAFRRRVNIRALSPANIKGMEEQTLKNIRYFYDILVDGEGKDWSAPRNMSELIGYLVSDIMGDVTFSKSFDVQRKPDNRDVLTGLPRAVAGIHAVGYMPEIVTFGHHKIFFRNMIADIARFITLKNCNDYFSTLLQARDDKAGQGFSTEQLVAEAGLFTVAEPEIRSNFSSIEDIRIGAHLASCHYLLARVEETLRLTPPVGSTLMHEVSPGGLYADGKRFPPGTDIAVPHYALRHDERYSPDPFTFTPERWLSKATGASDTIDVGVTTDLGPESTDSAHEKVSTLESLAASAFTAFGVGRTSCFGKYLAYREVQLVVARTLWLFDMRLEPGATLGEGEEGGVSDVGSVCDGSFEVPSARGGVLDRRWEESGAELGLSEYNCHSSASQTRRWSTSRNPIDSLLSR
ncbi:cytochrome P450 [Karstenula rhodostoma CBS 690.94]|uniref:Cytochrome P450 n=1 Tax=Karstenula rhodostoma CBS 690.94 TaxID=1392251 RepID=A0A9P4PJP9_9PLEO|nr:cytochrome P450 [Karstenula rhodostoma CBS 690.94]